MYSNIQMHHLEPKNPSATSGSDRLFWSVVTRIFPSCRWRSRRYLKLKLKETQNNVTSKGHASFGRNGWVFYGATLRKKWDKASCFALKRGNRWEFGRWTFYRFSSSGQTQPLFSRNDFFRFRFWGPKPASGEILEETRNPWVFLYGGKHHTPTASTSSAPKMKNFQEIGGRGPK